MSIATTCCLNLPPPPTSNKAGVVAPLKPNQVSWSNNNEGSWRNQWVVAGLTCMIIGAEMGPLLGTGHHAVAVDYRAIVEKENKGGPRWSDKRACPPWEANSLVIIVPENLPRPFTHRNSETVSLPRKSVLIRSDQIVGVRNKCFSL
ncbi:hypothetical protein GIB67_030658 [Kingdonia uniflora]|uniref:Uncharacterized protein n=1 Tax=Kingdonia uniflora TaxID=39325 RepID=A0A7J7NIE8_9MAGN|nr:hypothetical protein GIB67_030658 [Kingdonia uniflora]